MNLFTKQTPSLQKQTYGYQRGRVGGGAGRNGSLGLAEANYYIWMDKQQGPTI